MSDQTAHVIRTSDRQTFKRCRQLWDFGSKIRQNYEPLMAPKPFDFGTAIHFGLQTYYDPRTWDLLPQGARAHLALEAFEKITKDQKGQYLKITSGDLAIDLEIDFKERIELGRGMLEYYFSVAQKLDKGWKPKLVEIEFEVPVLVPEDMYLSGRFGEIQRHLYYKADPVVYQGRVDLVMEDPFGEYWIWDHKTAAQFGTTQHLALDEQCGSYIWALKHQLGLNVAGVVYNELRKKVPHPPAELKNGGLSKNKQQDTTYDLYVAAIEAGGYNRSHYEDFLEYLQECPKEFVRRTQVHRNAKEMEIQSKRICLEAIDMLNNPSIYPNPVKWNCDGCWMFAPCLATQEGGDVDFILREGFRKRDEVPEQSSTAT
jgi:hypothetical protein